MACFRLHGEGLPFSDKFVCFARLDGHGYDVKRGDALHGEDVKRTDSNAVLFAIAAVAINDGKHFAGFRPALDRAEFHGDLDAGRYTRHE